MAKKAANPIPKYFKLLRKPLFFISNPSSLKLVAKILKGVIVC